MKNAKCKDHGSKPYYHRHICECPCDCKTDTCGYGICAACSFDESCREARRTPEQFAKAHEDYLSHLACEE